MEQLRLGRSVVKNWVPVLLTKKKEAVKERAICFPQDEED